MSVSFWLKLLSGLITTKTFLSPSDHHLAQQRLELAGQFFNSADSCCLGIIIVLQHTDVHFRGFSGAGKSSKSTDASVARTSLFSIAPC